MIKEFLKFIKHEKKNKVAKNSIKTGEELSDIKEAEEVKISINLTNNKTEYDEFII